MYGKVIKLHVNLADVFMNSLKYLNWEPITKSL